MGTGTTKDQLRELLLETTQEYEILVNPIKRLSQLIAETSAAQKELIKSGGTFFGSYTANANKFSSAISNVAKDSQELFGNAKQGVDAFRDLSIQMKSFVSFTSDTQETLANTSMRMKALGFDTNSLAKVMDSAALAFGKSGKELNSLALDLAGLSQKYMISPQQLVGDFEFAQKNFAYTSKKFMENFEDLQKMSRKTGISFSTMTSAFGDKMDTFQGSTEVAGKLNAILGKSALNTLDLLGKTEAERAVTIRKALLQSGQDVDNMGKFQLKAISSTLGLGSIEDTRKFLQGKSDEMGGSKSLNKRLKANADDPTMSKFGDFDGALKDTSGALNDLTSIIKNMRTPFEASMIDFGNMFGEKSTELINSSFKKILDTAVKEKKLTKPQSDALQSKFQDLDDPRTRQLMVSQLTMGQLDIKDAAATTAFSLEQRYGQTGGLDPKSKATESVETALKEVEIMIKNQTYTQEGLMKILGPVVGGLAANKTLNAIGLDSKASTSLALTVGTQMGDAFAKSVKAQAKGIIDAILSAF